MKRRDFLKVAGGAIVGGLVLPGLIGKPASAAKSSSVDVRTVVKSKTNMQFRSLATGCFFCGHSPCVEITEVET